MTVSSRFRPLRPRSGVLLVLVLITAWAVLSLIGWPADPAPADRPGAAGATGGRAGTEVAPVRSPGAAPDAHHVAGARPRSARGGHDRVMARPVPVVLVARAGRSARSEPAVAGRWRWPLDGRPDVVRPFDPPATRYGPGHRGVDLGSAPGNAVRAAGPGTVGYAGLLAGRGVVSVLHGSGLRTTYEPVVATVHVGQRVAAGTPLGHLAAGHPGCVRAACLHWGLLRGAMYLDPLALVGRGQVRLLPLGDEGPPAVGGGRFGRPSVPPVGSAGDDGEGATRPRGATGSEPSSSRGGGPTIPAPAMAAAVGLAVVGAVLLARGRPP